MTLYLKIYLLFAKNDFSKKKTNLLCFFFSRHLCACSVIEAIAPQFNGNAKLLARWKSKKDFPQNNNLIFNCPLLRTSLSLHHHGNDSKIANLYFLTYFVLCIRWKR